MIILALDTALEACSVALGEGRVALAKAYELCGRAHAERLLPMIDHVLGEARLDACAIARIGVTVGPGSFTGLRTGLAAARGLSLALSCPAIGVTTSMALAAAAPKGVPLAVAIDARRAEIYLAAFDARGLETLAPRALALADAPAVLAGLSRAWRIVGSAAEALSIALTSTGLDATVIPEIVWPHAAHMLALVAEAPLPSAPPRPLYLRAADAAPMQERPQ
jgi:tRNA threonylcarbamoyl adenosine modification protein YeaZ